MNFISSDPQFRNGSLFGAALTASCIFVFYSLNRKKVKTHDCIYLDFNATTPLYPSVAEAMKDAMDNSFGNPSSTHVYGEMSKQEVMKARSSVGDVVNAPTPLESIIFTGCGTESDNRAIDFALHIFQSRQESFTHTFITESTQSSSSLPIVITSSIEHPAIIKYLKYLENKKVLTIHIVPVNHEGFISVDDVETALSTNVALVTIMHSNNEVGTIQPIREISQRIRQFNEDNKCGILFHSDAAQSIGKVPVDVQYLGVDMLTIVGHKYGAPKGIAALYINPAIIPLCQSVPMLIGGGQELGLRGGTESVLLIIALGEASRLALRRLRKNILHMLQMKLRLVSGLKGAFAAHPTLLRFNGPHRHSIPMEIEAEISLLNPLFASVHNDKTLCQVDLIEQLPNTVSVSFRGVKAPAIIAKLSHKVACSAGSACHSASSSIASTNSNHSISDVLLAMGVPDKYALGTLRLSFGPSTNAYEIDQAVAHIQKAILSELD